MYSRIKLAQRKACPRLPSLLMGSNPSALGTSCLIRSSSISWGLRSQQIACAAGVIYRGALGHTPPAWSLEGLETKFSHAGRAYMTDTPINILDTKARMRAHCHRAAGETSMTALGEDSWTLRPGFSRPLP